MQKLDLEFSSSKDSNKKNAIVVIAKVHEQPVGSIGYEIGKKTPFCPMNTEWWNDYIWIYDIPTSIPDSADWIKLELLAYVEREAKKLGIDELHTAMDETEGLGFGKFYAVVARKDREKWVTSKHFNPDIEFRVFDGSAEDRALVKEGLVDIYEAEGRAEEFELEEEREIEVDVFLGMVETLFIAMYKGMIRLG